jgi:hypothetical protein
MRAGSPLNHRFYSGHLSGFGFFVKTKEPNEHKRSERKGLLSASVDRSVDHRVLPNKNDQRKSGNRTLQKEGLEKKMSSTPL